MRVAENANHHVEGLGNGRKTWMVLECLDDGAVFLERGGGAVEQWFLDSGLRQDFGILDMSGNRAAYRAVKIPPPCCLGGPPALIPPETDEHGRFGTRTTACLSRMQ